MSLKLDGMMFSKNTFLMSFLIRFGFLDFVNGLAAGSTVYGLAFTEKRLQTAESIVLLTSDAGSKVGPIHAIRIEIEGDGTDALALAGKAHDKLEELLRLKRMTWRQGALMTEGLNDAIRYFGNSGPYSMKEIEGWLAKEKGKAKRQAQSSGRQPMPTKRTISERG